MKRTVFLLSLLLSVLCWSTPAWAQLPGPCAGTVTPFLQICVPPLGQQPWILEWQSFATKVDDHAATTTGAHGATSANTANTLVQRNSGGVISVTSVNGDLNGTAAAATSLVTNPTDCTGNAFATSIVATGNLGCETLTDADVPNSITADNYLPLTGGTLTGQLITDNLGIDFTESDTNPACGAGDFRTYADQSENKLKKCENGVVSDIGTAAGASGDITQIWTGCATGDCNALTAGSGDTFDAGAATASRPATRNTSLPGTASEGQWHHDTDSGGSETYVATSTNTFVKLATTTDTAPLATALVGNGTNCPAGESPLGVDASANAEGCFNVGTQTELDAHTNNTTTAHGATTSATANTLVKRDAAGGTIWQASLVTVATLPVCTTAIAVTRVAVSDGATEGDCTVGGGDTLVNCKCEGVDWGPDASGSGGSAGTLTSIYQNSGTTPTIAVGPNGLTIANANSLQKAVKICGTGPVCWLIGVDDSGLPFMTPSSPADMVWKPFSGKILGWLTSAGLPSLTSTAAGALTVATSLAGTGSGTVTANRTSCTGTDILKADGTCMSDVVRVINKVTADTTVTNTVTPTLIYSFSVPGGTLGTDSCLRLTCHGTVLQNSGVSRTPIMRMRYGGTTAPSITQTLADSATTKASTVTFHVCGDGATNAQREWGRWEVISITPQSTHGGPTADSTTSQSLEVEVELDAAHASFTYLQRYAVLERLP